MSTYLALENAHIHYPVVTSSRDVSILGAVAKTAGFGLMSRSSKSNSSFISALNNITLRLGEGARLGIVGRNGSGKSTLLRTLAGIHHPSKGKRVVEGRLASVLSVGAGLDPEKSGRQNVLQAQRLFGIGREQALNICNDIEAFVELEHFFDLPVRTYSTGMMVRLSFAIATSLPGDILLVDEVLGAGDVHFLAKAIERINERAQHAKVFAMATHSYDALRQFCTHAIWLHSGKIIYQGKPEDVWREYQSREREESLPSKSIAVSLHVAEDAAQAAQ
jgi:ABC-type polysaccharide/polyol phosphate transport system ATPase subunit